MSTRREFMAAATVAAVAPAVARAAEPRKAAPPLPYAFDQKRFNDILNQAAQHKQCFGARKIAQAGVLEEMDNSLNAYEQALHEPKGSLHAVAVLYGGPSILMAASDDFWNEFAAPFFHGAPAELRKDLGDVTLGKGNPYLHSTTRDPDDLSIERLASRGGSFFVCHNAVVGFSDLIATTLKKPVSSVYASMMDGMAPSALVVPAGVMAVNACQEAHFTYIAAS